MVEKIVRFKGRRYDFDRTIVTLISESYVPDWDLTKAIKESLQNMIDEKTETGCPTSWWLPDPDGPSFVDGGRGVNLEQIFIIGDSGKRGNDELIGQHGEGEVVSFMVAAREGVVKTMASQDWLAQGRLDKLEGRDVLHLDVYRCRTPRKGTAWRYSGSGARLALAIALDHFQIAIKQQKRQEQRDRAAHKRQSKAQKQRTRKRARQSALLNECKGNLYTNGQYVCNMPELAMAYNLKMTPGRDRIGFSWDQVKDEIQTVMESEFKAPHILKLFHATRRDGADAVLEFSLVGVELDVKEVQKAVRKFTNSRSLKKLGWAQFGQHASHLSDATSQGIESIGFHAEPPQWVKDSVHEISVLTGFTGKAKEGPLPQVLEKAVMAASKLLLIGQEEIDGIEFKSVLRDTGSKARAYASYGKVVLVRTAVKQMSIRAFLKVLAHEFGHAVYGWSDATREHEACTGRMLTRAMSDLMDNGERGEVARKNYSDAARYLAQYTGKEA